MKTGQEEASVGKSDKKSDKSEKFEKMYRTQKKRADDLENQLVDAKMKWANLDMENDEICLKMQ